jgi:hypothetical protein
MSGLGVQLWGKPQALWPIPPIPSGVFLNGQKCPCASFFIPKNAEMRCPSWSYFAFGCRRVRADGEFMAAVAYLLSDMLLRLALGAYFLPRLDVTCRLSRMRRLWR